MKLVEHSGLKEENTAFTFLPSCNVVIARVKKKKGGAESKLDTAYYDTYSLIFTIRGEQLLYNIVASENSCKQSVEHFRSGEERDASPLLLCVRLSVLFLFSI